MSERLISVQVLRAVAALAVTIAHTYVPVADLATRLHERHNVPGMVLGAAGVDLFFVISGFVMVYTTAADFGSPTGARDFFLRRLVRIAPLYWIATFAWLAYVLHISSFAQEHIDLRTIAAALLFVFHERDPGHVSPVLDQGWSLNYEMFFYLCFSVAMLFPRRMAIPTLLVAMVVPAGLSYYYGVAWPLPFALAMMINPMLWEFAAGVALGWAFVAGLRLPKWVGILLVLLGFALIAATAFEPIWFSPLRPYHWGGPCALIVAGAAFPCFDLRGAFWRTAAFVGDASYALYLFHGMIMLIAQHKAPLIMEAIFRYASPWGVVVLLVALSVAVSAAIHVAIERPMTRVLRHLIGRRTGRAFRYQTRIT